MGHFLNEKFSESLMPTFIFTVHIDQAQGVVTIWSPFGLYAFTSVVVLIFKVKKNVFWKANVFIKIN